MNRKELVGALLKAVILILQEENMAIGATLNDEGNPIPCIVDFETNDMYKLNFQHIGGQKKPEEEVRT